jgi:hypothetical protein
VIQGVIQPVNLEKLVLCFSASDYCIRISSVLSDVKSKDLPKNTQSPSNSPFSVIDLPFSLALSLKLKRFVACLTRRQLFGRPRVQHSRAEGGGNFAALSFLRNILGATSDGKKNVYR